MIIPKADRLNQVEEYYFSTKLREIKKLEQQGIQVINLGIGSPDLPPSEETIEALIQSARENSHHAYQPYRSTLELRQAFSKWYRQTYHVILNPETEILPLLGSKEGITYISNAFLNAGDEVLVPNPGYPAYAATTKMVGAKVRYYDLTEENNWYPDLDQLGKENLSKAKIMWVNYPHMPTGAPADAAVFRSLIRFANEHNILICHDNPYSLVLNPNPLSILNYDEEKQYCIELNSLSKSFNMAGWRIGMLAGHKDYLDAVLQVKSNVDSGMFLPVQNAAISALNNSPAWHDQKNAIYQERKKYALEILDHLGFSYSNGQTGMFVWAKAPDHILDVTGFLDDLLQNAHVFITPGFIFGEKGNRYARISLCSEAATFQEALDRIKLFTEKSKTQSHAH